MFYYDMLANVISTTQPLNSQMWQVSIKVSIKVMNAGSEEIIVNNKECNDNKIKL